MTMYSADFMLSASKLLLASLARSRWVTSSASIFAGAVPPQHAGCVSVSGHEQALPVLLLHSTGHVLVHCALSDHGIVASSVHGDRGK